MTIGEPIGLLLAITFGIAAIPMPQATGSDSIETITSVSGSAVSASLTTDSLESITSISGSATTAESYTDSLESIGQNNGTPQTADSDSLEGM